jgi:hypothetical protein
VTLQVPEARVQVAVLKVPVLLLEKVTVPVGVPVPVTVAVQVLAVLSRTLAGEHATVVVDPPEVIVRRNVPLLPVCTESPP